ncbi:MAG TPA: DciA family protein [Thermoleophilaceae bacterium]|nr:DciA family protein [Thermoleophilaceae bacterium]
MAPRPLRPALERASAAAAPAGLLASVQAVWADVAGAAVAAEAEPVSERERVVTFACRSAVWAQELELLAGELRERLNARLGGAGQLAALRFRTVSGRRS